MSTQESANAMLLRLVQAISAVDHRALTEVTTATIRLDVPGARDVDLTQKSVGPEALCDWATTVSQECGKVSFRLHRCFENGCELMAVGEMHIERIPTGFTSPCSIHAVFEQGQIAAFQLLVDTYALEKFRGLAD